MMHGHTNIKFKNRTGTFSQQPCPSFLMEFAASMHLLYVCVCGFLFYLFSFMFLSSLSLALRESCQHINISKSNILSSTFITAFHFSVAGEYVRVSGAAL